MLKKKESLAAHERGHTGERPHECAVCGNGFKSVGALGQHKRLVHKIVGPRATKDPNEKRVRKKK